MFIISLFRYINKHEPPQAEVVKRKKIFSQKIISRKYLLSVYWFSVLFFVNAFERKRIGNTNSCALGLVRKTKRLFSLSRVIQCLRFIWFCCSVRSSFMFVVVEIAIIKKSFKVFQTIIAISRFEPRTITLNRFLNQLH